MVIEQKKRVVELKKQKKGGREKVGLGFVLYFSFLFLPNLANLEYQFYLHFVFNFFFC